MPQPIIRHAGTGADDSSAGTAAWTSPGNVTTSDGLIQVGTANCAFVNSLAAAAVSHRLKCTNYAFGSGENPVLSGDTITGIRAYLGAGITSAAGTPVLSECKLVKAGTIQATSRSASNPFVDCSQFGGRYAFETPLGTLDSAVPPLPSDLWGGAWAAADVTNSGFGVVFSATNNHGSVAAQPIVDSAMIEVLVTRTFGISVSTNGGSANLFRPIVCSAVQSGFGAWLPNNCEITWSVRFNGTTWYGEPISDFRPGTSVLGQARYIGQDYAGFVFAFLPDAAGSYDVTATLRAPDGTTSASTSTFTVAADTSTVYYVDSSKSNDSGDGLTPATAKKTLAGAITAGGVSNVTYRLKDAQVHTVKDVALNGASKVRIGRTNDASNPPTLTLDGTSATGGILYSGSDILIQDLWFDGSAASHWMFTKYGAGSAMSGLTLSKVKPTTTYYGMLYIAPGSRNVLVERCAPASTAASTTGWTSYGIFADPAADLLFFLGCHIRVDSTGPVGDGMIRLTGDSGGTTAAASGVGVGLAWNRFDATNEYGAGGVRVSMSYVTSYQNYYQNCGLGLCESRASSNATAASCVGRADGDYYSDGLSTGGRYVTYANCIGPPSAHGTQHHLYSARACYIVNCITALDPSAEDGAMLIDNGYAPFEACGGSLDNQCVLINTALGYSTTYVGFRRLVRFNTSTTSYASNSFIGLSQRNIYSLPDDAGNRPPISVVDAVTEYYLKTSFFAVPTWFSQSWSSGDDTNSMVWSEIGDDYIVPDHGTNRTLGRSPSTKVSVLRDYRGVARDQTPGAIWAAGATGTEARASGVSGTSAPRVARATRISRVARL